MYQRIMTAIDGSETSLLALKEAIKLAKEHKAKLCLIYVADETLPVNLEGVWVDFKEYESSIRKSSQAILDKMTKTAKEEYSAVESHLAEMNEYNDRIADQIIKEAKNWEADLLVIGTHGRRGFNRFFLGSVAEGVTRIAPIPVLLIRGHETKKA